MCAVAQHSAALTSTLRCAVQPAVRYFRAALAHPCRLRCTALHCTSLHSFCRMHVLSMSLCPSVPPPAPPLLPKGPNSPLLLAPSLGACSLPPASPSLACCPGLGLTRGPQPNFAQPAIAGAFHLLSPCSCTPLIVLM